MTPVVMPEAAVNENYATEPRQYDVGFAGQVWGMEPKSEPHSVKASPDK